MTAVRSVTSALVGLVHIREIHAAYKLQTRDLPGMMLHFQIGPQDSDMDGFTLGRVLAFNSDAVKLKVPVVSFNEFVDDGLIHGN